MKVLVTGANGLLGSHVVRELLGKKIRVRILVRDGCDLRSIEGLNVELCKGSITNESDINGAISGVDYVIHAAAKTSQDSSNLDSYFQPNIQSTRFIINACKKHDIKRLVFVSTANCFGNGTKEKPGNEKNDFLPWLKHSGYAYSKYRAQNIVLDEVKNKDLNAVVVNPTFIIGTKDYKPSSGQIFGHIINRKIAFYPPGGKNFSDAAAVARGIVNAMELGVPGDCYLLAGENYSYREFFTLVKQVLKQKTILIKIPGFLLLGVGLLGTVYEKVSKKPVPLTYTNARMLCLENYFTPLKAKNELKYEPVPIHESVKKTTKWFLTNNFFNETNMHSQTIKGDD